MMARARCRFSVSVLTCSFKLSQVSYNTGADRGLSSIDQSTLGNSSGRPSKTGCGTLDAEVIRVFATKHDPDSVADRPLYSNRNRFDGVWRVGSAGLLWVWCEVRGVLGAGWGVSAPASMSNAVGGWAPIAAMIARTGLVWGRGNDAFVDVGRLGF